MTFQLRARVANLESELTRDGATKRNALSPILYDHLTFQAHNFRHLENSVGKDDDQKPFELAMAAVAQHLKHFHGEGVTTTWYNVKRVTGKSTSALVAQRPRLCPSMVSERLDPRLTQRRK